MDPSSVLFLGVSPTRLAIGDIGNTLRVPHHRKSLAVRLLAAIVTLLPICAVVTPVSAQSYSIIFNFHGGVTGSRPIGLTMDAAGRLYGATADGGSGNCFLNGCGVVFMLTH